MITSDHSSINHSSNMKKKIHFSLKNMSLFSDEILPYCFKMALCEIQIAVQVSRYVPFCKTEKSLHCDYIYLKLLNSKNYQIPGIFSHCQHLFMLNKSSVHSRTSFRFSFYKISERLCFWTLNYLLLCKRLIKSRLFIYVPLQWHSQGGEADLPKIPVQALAMGME